MFEGINSNLVIFIWRKSIFKFFTVMMVVVGDIHDSYAKNG